MIAERIAVRCDWCVAGYIISAGGTDWSPCVGCSGTGLRSETDEEMKERLEGEDDRRELEREARRRP